MKVKAYIKSIDIHNDDYESSMLNMDMHLILLDGGKDGDIWDPGKFPHIFKCGEVTLEFGPTPDKPEYVPLALPTKTKPICKVDHHSVCKKDAGHCPKCGRQMCKNCVTDDQPSNMPHSEGVIYIPVKHSYIPNIHKGECLICSEMYTEDEIILCPLPNILVSSTVLPIKTKKITYRRIEI